MTFLDRPLDDEPQPQSEQVSPIVASLITAAAAAGTAAVLLVREFIANTVREVGEFDVDSSCIQTLEYSLVDGSMTVVFTDGSVYDYPYVPPHNFVRFLMARSKGQFFNSEVRGRW
jgi:hypothetical protein